MSIRTLIYETLTSPGLPHDAHTRVFAKKSMTSSVEAHPFIVYKLGNNTDLGLSETRLPHNQFFQVWVHDFMDVETGDYLKIDDVISAVKARFFNLSSPEDGVLQVQYLETSQDLDDITLSTLVKYIRFQAIMEG